MNEPNTRAVIGGATRAVREYYVKMYPQITAILPDIDVTLISCAQIQGAWSLLFEVSMPVSALCRVEATYIREAYCYEITEFLKTNSASIVPHIPS